jgi:L,D-transpeptidase ErfK/SrfK
MSYSLAMKHITLVVRPLGILVAGAALASCSLLGEGWQKPREPVPAPAPVVPADPPPAATHSFILEDGQDVVGVLQRTTATQDDTLTDIARRFNLGYEELVRANPGVDPWLPGEGTQIVLPTQFVLPNAPREGLVINVPQMRLFYYPARKQGEPQMVVTHPIGIGKVGWRTPEGTTKIVRRQKDPTWRPTPSIIKEHRKNGEELERVIGPGPDNPLGRYAFYLGWPSYMIHGTNKPAGVGLRSSHGCLRLYPEDIEALFESVPVGTKVRVVNEPFVFGWQAGELRMQAFDVLEDDTRDWRKAERKLLSKSLGESIRKELKQRGEEIDWEHVSTFTRDPRGIPVSISSKGASLDQVVAAAHKVQNRVPDGASWDGKSDLPMDEQSFQEMVSDSEPKEQGDAPAASPQNSKTGT